MRVVFLSNYFTPHQRGLSDALYEATGGNYTFVATVPPEQDRRDLGWDVDDVPAYVLNRPNLPSAELTSLILGADALITGSAPEELVRPRIKAKKLVFRYSERPLKHGPEPLKAPARYVKWHRMNPSQSPIYLLSAGGYAAEDYVRYGLFKGRAYRWGYFPAMREHDANSLMANKNGDEAIWCGRFLDWKRPCDALAVAKRLKDKGVDGRLALVGTGPELGSLQAKAAELGLVGQISIEPSMPYSALLNRLDHARVLLFTSGYEEGWGVILNDAMNAGCAVVASDAAGSSTFLIQNGVNGFRYPMGNVGEATELTARLLQDQALRGRIGRAAYRTIAETWNCDVGANRLLALSEAILGGDPAPDLYADGPCSLIKGPEL